jgi:hypothetical protein
MPRQWTPEQRKELGEKIRAAKAAKKLGVQTVVINPIADDLVTTPRPRSAILRRQVTTPAEGPGEPDGLVNGLLTALVAIPLETISYDDCGRLLNAFSVASTSVAQARRQRQEQLEAGSHRAICKTCGRPIDISKSGGFQILTERDEHFMPINRYYCSQNCLLARNMPSHAKSTPRQKQVNQA